MTKHEWFFYAGVVLLMVGAWGLLPHRWQQIIDGVAFVLVVARFADWLTKKIYGEKNGNQ